MTHDAASAAALPPGACDCHFHVFDPAYPLAASASVAAPERAKLSDYRKVQAELGLTRGVLVQSSTYGFDNRCMLAALAELGASSRGVVTVAPSVDDATLAQLHAAGVRGVRFMMLNQPVLPWDALLPMAARIAPLGWHVNLQIDGADFPHRLQQLANLPIPLVIDHNGKFLSPPGVDAPEFRALRSLMDTGRCWVKLSAPYETSRSGATMPMSAYWPVPWRKPIRNLAFGRATGPMSGGQRHPGTRTCCACCAPGHRTPTLSDASLSTTRNSFTVSDLTDIYRPAAWRRSFHLSLD